MMCLSQTDQREGELMSMMIYKEINNRGNILEETDEKLNNTLNNQIYSLFLGYCEEKSMIFRSRHISQLLNKLQKQDRKAFKYIKFMHDNMKYYEKRIKKETTDISKQIY